MRMPHARFTIRLLMVAVAGAGIALGGADWLRRRSRQFEDLVKYHQSEQVCIFAMGTDRICRALNSRHQPVSAASGRWHSDMEKKYRHAALHPWLPVESDPPQPD